jgi:hypothetical protein
MLNESRRAITAKDLVMAEPSQHEVNGKLSQKTETIADFRLQNAD